MAWACNVSWNELVYHSYGNGPGEVFLNFLGCCILSFVASDFVYYRLPFSLKSRFLDLWLLLIILPYQISCYQLLEEICVVAIAWILFNINIMKSFTWTCFLSQWCSFSKECHEWGSFCESDYSLEISSCGLPSFRWDVRLCSSITCGYIGLPSTMVKLK